MLSSSEQGYQYTLDWFSLRAIKQEWKLGLKDRYVCQKYLLLLWVFPVFLEFHRLLGLGDSLRKIV